MGRGLASLDAICGSMSGIPDSDEPAPGWAAIGTLPRAAAAHPVRAIVPTHLDHRQPENRPGSSGWTLTVTHQQAEAISPTLRPVAGRDRFVPNEGVQAHRVASEGCRPAR